MSQYQLDFVDVSNEQDTSVYVDPYAIEVRDDEWAAEASENIRSFFKEVLDSLRDGDDHRAVNLMSHLHEPKETYLGVSQGAPIGRGVGARQASQLIKAIQSSKAFKTGILSDLSEMALYVEGIDRDKISDLTTNIIRNLLVDYTKQQCELHEIETERYSGPSFWDRSRKNWVSREVQLPFINKSPVILIPKYIVRRKLSIDSQEFYNKQITDFLVAENLKANSSLVQTIKGVRKVLKGDVRDAHPKSKSLIAEMVLAHPELLDMYKDVAKRHSPMGAFHEDEISIHAVCASLAEFYKKTPSGATHATDYQKLVMGSLTALFYPDLILPKIEWSINGGRKRIDISYVNSANTGFFAQRRTESSVNANIVIVECKNYSKDIANPELDQLLGRFDNNKGKFGIITCRSIDDSDLMKKRCRDAAITNKGYIIALTDEDLVTMLKAKSTLNDNLISEILYKKYQELLS